MKSYKTNTYGFFITLLALTLIASACSKNQNQAIQLENKTPAPTTTTTTIKINKIQTATSLKENTKAIDTNPTLTSPKQPTRSDPQQSNTTVKTPKRSNPQQSNTTVKTPKYPGELLTPRPYEKPTKEVIESQFGIGSSYVPFTSKYKTPPGSTLVKSDTLCSGAAGVYLFTMRLICVYKHTTEQIEAHEIAHAWESVLYDTNYLIINVYGRTLSTDTFSHNIPGDGPCPQNYRPACQSYSAELTAECVTKELGLGNSTHVTLGGLNLAGCEKPKVKAVTDRIISHML